MLPIDWNEAVHRWGTIIIIAVEGSLPADPAEATDLPAYTENPHNTSFRVPLTLSDTTSTPDLRHHLSAGTILEQIPHPPPQLSDTTPHPPVNTLRDLPSYREPTAFATITAAIKTVCLAVVFTINYTLELAVSATSRSRETLADLAAVEALGGPQSTVATLRRVLRHEQDVRGGRTRPAETSHTKMFRTHPHTKK